jgi:hypothetical protein
MNYQTLATAAALIALPFAVPCASAAKAYDLVIYKGKAAGLTVAFEFADGYPEANHLEITESASGKTIKFLLPDAEAQVGTGKMRFVPVKGDDKTKEVLLDIDAEGPAPSTVKGTYTSGEKTVRFILTKIEDH